MNGPTNARSFVNGANLMTAASLAAGFVALMLASRGELVWAAAAVGVAAVLDSLDGLLARRLSVCGPFGCQLDSLADMVAFGAAPALMLALGVFDGIPLVGVPVCIAFVLCGAWRLARFPLIAESHRFLGLPIPPAGVIAAVLAALTPPAGLALAVTLVLTALMVSEVPFPTFRRLGQRRSLPRPHPRRFRRPLRRRRREAATAQVGVSPSRRRH